MLQNAITLRPCQTFAHRDSLNYKEFLRQKGSFFIPFKVATKERISKIMEEMVNMKYKKGTMTSVLVYQVKKEGRSLISCGKYLKRN